MSNRTKISSVPKTTTTTATFLPTSITGCAFWLDGADPTSVVFSSGSNISQWNDKSGNAKNITQSTTSNQPSYTAASNSVLFSDTTFLNMGNTTYFNTLFASAYTMFFVHKKLQSYAWLVSPGNFVVTFPGTLRVTTAGITDLDYTTPTFSSAATEPLRIFTIQLTGTERNVRMNGQLTAYNMNNNGSTSWTTAPVVDSNWRMGGNWNSASSAGQTQNMYEVIFYNTALGTTQRQQVEGYLAQKWGLTSSLPAGHPGLTTLLYGTVTSVITLPKQKLTSVPRTTTTTYTFLPTSIAGCQLWLDGADATTKTFSGSNITVWNDKSGNARHMNTLPPSPSAGASVYPTSGTLINGLATVNFIPQSGIKQSTTFGGVTNLFWVGRIAAPGASYGENYYFLLGHDSSYDWCGRPYGDKFVDSTYTQSGIYNASPVSLFTPDTNAIANATFSSVYMPTSPNVSILSVAGITGSTSYQGLCYDRTNHHGWCGDLAEVIIFSTALSTPNRQTVEAYLAQKWGLTASLPAGHPGLTTTLYGSVTLPKQKITAISNIYSLITLSSTATTFSYTGADQTFTVPANVYAVVAYIWGAGGGGSAGQPGGAGAFAQVIVPVTPGQAYTIIVGQGGIQTTSATYGGGGLGSIANAWAGGGRSAIRYSGADIVTLGAGAGTGQDTGSTGGVANWSPLINGGAGYPSTAAQNVAIVSGKGGTQTAGGAGGAAAGGLGTQYNGGAGGLNYGGAGGVSPAPTGGGGSGYYGGGGGGGGPYYCTGGGGGSSLLNNVIPITGGNSPNSQNQAPGTSSSYYTGSVAIGGTTGAGGNGLVVLTYATASSQLKGLTMSRSGTTITMTWSASSYATSYYWALYYNATNSATGGALNNYGTTSSATATATIATGGYYYFAVSGLNASGGVSQVAFSSTLTVPLLFSLTSGLLAFFSFDKTIADFQNVITLTVTGSVSYVTGRTNQAIYLANETNSAASTYATNYLTSTYSLTTPFSVSLWFNPTNTNKGCLISTYNTANAINNGVDIYIAEGTVSAAYNNVQNVGASVAISVGTWYHAVVTVNASNLLTFYVNGSQVGSTITQTIYSSGLMIGCVQDGGSSYAFSGYIDDYRIYSRVLTGTEVGQIYAGTG